MQPFLQALQSVDSNEGQEAWRTFLFNVVKLQELGPVDTDVAAAVLSAGRQWQGGGWNSTSASRALWEAVGTGLVASEFSEYLHCWLYACALYWKVDVPSASLSPEAAQAAFALYATVSGEWEDEELEEEGPEGPAEQPVVFNWEQPGVPLPAELGTLWRKYGVGDSKFDLKTLLDNTPRYQDLPHKAAENNHLQDGKSKVDKALKWGQQCWLHSLRLQAGLYDLLQKKPTQQQVVDLLQQNFAYGASVFRKMQVERREASMPGSTPVQEEVLFGKEEVQQAKFRSQVLTPHHWQKTSRRARAWIQSRWECARS